MIVANVTSAFLAACPSIGLAWKEHLRFWGDEPKRGDYNDASVIVHHVVDCFERADLSEFPGVFALLERCLVEGEDEVRNLATVGYIEVIQNVASHRPFGPWVFYDWLGPASRIAWDELCVFWRQVGEMKAAGLLEPRSGLPLPSVDPSDVQDPELRRMLEEFDRK